MGSKARFVKQILPIMLKDKDKYEYYIEPFAGGMNVICEVTGLKRIAADNNKYLIEMWKFLSENKTVPLKSEEITRELYDSARDMFFGRIEKTLTDYLIGYIGFMGSANGKFFDGGWSGISITKDGKVRNYIAESINNIQKQIVKLTDNINFFSCQYFELQYPKNSIIYCDIPYKGTTSYGTSKNFDYEKFWNWATEMSKNGYNIYISEYDAPQQFETLLTINAKSSLSANGKTGKSKNSIEKLFKLKL